MTFQPTTSPAAPDFPREWTPIFPGGASSYDEYMRGDFPGKNATQEARLDAEHERRKRLRSREVSEVQWARAMGMRARLMGTRARSQLLPIPETRPVGPGTGPTQERVDARERKRKREARDAARARARARFATEEQRTI